MARKYDLVTIDDVVYELHAVKSDKKKLGLVPVRYFADEKLFMDWVRSLPNGEIELLHADWKYGNAVRLQRMARELATGDKFTDAAFNKMYATIDQDTLLSFHQNYDGLRDHLKELWEQQQADVNIDETHVYEELL